MQTECNQKRQTPEEARQTLPHAQCWLRTPLAGRPQQHSPLRSSADTGEQPERPTIGRTLSAAADTSPPPPRCCAPCAACFLKEIEQLAAKKGVRDGKDVLKTLVVRLASKTRCAGPLVLASTTASTLPG